MLNIFDDPGRKEEFFKGLAELDEKLKMWEYAIEESGRITEEDLNIIIY